MPTEAGKRRFALVLIKPRSDYMDAALEPVTDHEEERALFQSEAARGYLEKVHRIERIQRGVAVG